MSLSKEAIQHMQSAESCARVMEQLTGNLLHPSAVAVPESVSVEDLERFLPNARRLTGHFHTSTIAAFCRYLAEYSTKCLCTVHQAGMTSFAVLDFGDAELPLHQSSKATLKLVRTAAYRGMLSFAGRQSQQDLGDLIEDFSDFITVTDSSGAVISNQLAASKFRNVSIDQARNVSSGVDNYSADMSVSEKIELRNKESMPAAIEFKCLPYSELSERTFTIKPSAITSGEKPSFSCRIVGFEQLQEEMAIEFEHLINDELEKYELDNITVIAGEI